ncbi:uncharacterized protein LOC116351449 [Contarinia nasturtii]|uniref:uncharacterized protein LOC116351449 n=1 Tax=Contarinia nasturtii TaxID=265458 RepID=UPI0012D3BA78|nr:uncharacterized protein LOC116351449 [Contarinia nasturtii]
MSQSRDFREFMQPVAGSSYGENSPKLFKLNIDCFETIFDYLSLTDLHSFGQTCTRMQKVAGTYFNQNYSSANHSWCINGIHTNWIATWAFNQFVPSISIDQFHYNLDINKCNAINRIHLYDLRLDQNKIKRFKRILDRVETFQFNRCAVDDFYDLILKHCTNLKRLYVQRNTSIYPEESRYTWLQYEYPTLEHLEFIPSSDDAHVFELNIFFMLNKSVQRFSTSEHFLWNNRLMFLNFDAKLDILEIKENNVFNRNNSPESGTLFWKLLNQLYNQGFYKRLYYCIDNDIDKGLSMELSAVKGLESLQFFTFIDVSICNGLAQLTNLRELRIKTSNNIDMDILARGLVKLERLCIEGTINDIIPFIRRSTILKKINLLQKCQMNQLFENVDCKTFNLVKLNAERARLPGAQKVIIHVSEDLYLKTKWSARNGDTDLSVIELRRADSYQWDPYFSVERSKAFLLQKISQNSSFYVFDLQSF